MTISLESLAEPLAQELSIKYPYLSTKEDYYVYVLLDPRYPGAWEYSVKNQVLITFDYRPFYVGKGKGRRMAEHYRDAIRNSPGRANVNEHKESIIRKANESGLKIYEVMLDRKTGESLALAKEMLLIEAMGRVNSKTGILANKTAGGEGARQVVWTLEMREAVSKLFTGKKRSPEVVQHLRELNTGKTHTEETKQKLREIKIGKKHSEETKAKVSKALSGRPVSQETREKLSATLSGKKRTEESKARMRKPKSDAARVNMSEAAKNRAPITEETRQKLVDGLKKRIRKPWSPEARARMSERLRKDFAEGSRKPSNKYIKEAESGIQFNK